MAKKDTEEKLLEDYNDVFADIVNVNMFHGKQVVKQRSLENIKDRSRFKSIEGIITEQERDVAKRWKTKNISFALIGIENQTTVDNDMCFRLYSYDGAAYKSQYGKKDKCPVFTFVLYFGTTHWNTNIRLSDCLNIPDSTKEFFNDYKMNLIEVAWQTDKQLSMYKSDFKYVAEYFIQKRKNEKYHPSNEKIKHVDSILKMMSALTGDDRFERIINERKKGERRPQNMCEILDEIEGRGIQKGIIKTLSDLVKDGLISINEAAKRANMPIPKFKKEAGLTETIKR